METPNLIGTKLGNYRIERLLGRGRMGAVYLARDEALLRPTAVKVLSWAMPEASGRSPEAWFLSEARSVARVNHPSVVQIYSVARQGSTCYIAMEYVDGAPADALVSRKGPLSTARATEILLQVANALHAAHTSGVVHRDVKPENILMRNDGAAKLGDFGMASRVQDSQPTATRAGTPYYTAPEIWRGLPAGPASDIYALGATYFFLLTGRHPFESPDIPSLISAHLNAPVPDLRSLVPGVPEVCGQIIQQCMAKSPSERFATAQALGWAARGVLRLLNSQPERSKLSGAPPADDQNRSARPSADSPQAPWVSHFGFSQQPFGDCDPSEAPYQGVPFTELAADLRQAVAEQRSCALVLSGPVGSGRTVLARHLIATRARSGQSAYVLLGEGEEAPASLLRNAAQAFGALFCGSEDDIELLLAQLDRGPKSADAPALLVLDNARPTPGNIKDLRLLLRAAKATTLFKVLLVGASDLPQQLRRAAAPSEECVTAFTVPPLSSSQSLEYLRAWVRFVSPNAPRLALTPDALLILAHRAGGNPGKLNRLACNALRLAFLFDRQIADSWDAWNASETATSADSSPVGPEPLPERTAPWPSQEVLELINSFRAGEGIPQRRGKSEMR